MKPQLQSVMETPISSNQTNMNIAISNFNRNAGFMTGKSSLIPTITAENILSQNQTNLEFVFNKACEQELLVAENQVAKIGNIERVD